MDFKQNISSKPTPWSFDLKWLVGGTSAIEDNQSEIE